MSMTNTVNIFDQTEREIRCIAKEHDYLGTGEIFVEEELEIGRIYTYTHGRAAAYGNMVFLRELPNRWGYQAYLFEELKPYDDQEYKRKSREGLIGRLDAGRKSMEGHRRVSKEEKAVIRQRIRERIRAYEKFEPHFTEGHDPGASYWICPVAVRDSARIEYTDIREIKDQEISVPQRYFDPLLTDFFTDGINPELPINAHRYSTDDVPGGIPIYGFKWYLHPNFYKYSDMEMILRRMGSLVGDLRYGSTGSASARQQNRLRTEFAQAAEYVPNLTYEGAMIQTAEFYDKLILRIRRMMEECTETDVICVMTP